MSRSHGPTTPTRARGGRQAGRQSRQTGADGDGGRPRRPPRPSAELSGAERGRYMLRRTGHFALMALICIVINIIAVVLIGAIAFVVYSLVK